MVLTVILPIETFPTYSYVNKLYINTTGISKPHKTAQVKVKSILLYRNDVDPLKICIGNRLS